MNGSTVVIGEARLGCDPDLRTVGAQGLSVCDLWVAWDDDKRTNWGHVTVWGEDAVSVAATGKGSKISVSGHLRSEEYQAKDGTKRRVMKIVADQLEVKSAKPRSDEEAAEPRQGKRAA